jgi:hypothetical protein
MPLLRVVDPARATRAVEIGALNCKSIASTLGHNLDRRA